MTKTLVKAEAHIWQFFQPTPILIWPFIRLPPTPSPPPPRGDQGGPGGTGVKIDGWKSYSGDKEK